MKDRNSIEMLKKDVSFCNEILGRIECMEKDVTQLDMVKQMLSDCKSIKVYNKRTKER